MLLFNSSPCVPLPPLAVAVPEFVTIAVMVLVIFAAGGFLCSWMYFRGRAGVSPLPSIPEITSPFKREKEAEKPKPAGPRVGI